MEQTMFKLTPSTSEGINAVKVQLEGDLTIRNAQKLKQQLEKAYKKYDMIEVVMEKISAIDISCIQIIYSLKKAVQDHKKEMSLKLNVSKEIENALKFSGMGQMLHPEKFKESI